MVGMRGRDSTVSHPVGNGVGGICADSVDPLRTSPHVLGWSEVGEDRAGGIVSGVGGRRR
jgi:hypothetical protein